MNKVLRVFFYVTVAILSAALTPARAQGQSAEPGDFDYYTLALSWSPTHCRVVRDRRNSDQCEQSHAFVLHGLWPQFYRGWPEFCRTSKREWVSDQLIRDMLDIMPGKGLIIHQYRKHGACSGMTPDRYFGTARALFESIKIPEQFKRLSSEAQTTPEEVERAFLQANPQLDADMIAVSCKQGMVEEVRVCFGRDRKPGKCGQNENQARICKFDRLTMPPVKGAQRGI
jgi:ribonuclease T2